MVQQEVEPAYNPRRLLRMVMMDMPDEAFWSPTTWLCSACDLCYPACPLLPSDENSSSLMCTTSSCASDQLQSLRSADLLAVDMPAIGRRELR